MTPDLYWFLITESIRYYVTLAIQVLSNFVISYVIPYGAPCIMSLVTVCVAYTFIVNLHRKPDDPKKREYNLFAILLAPFTFFPFLFLAILLFILRAVLFAGFLSVFTIGLLLFRKPLLFVWWDKFATRIGDPLLKANTRLIQIAFRPWNRGTGAA